MLTLGGRGHDPLQLQNCSHSPSQSYSVRSGTFIPIVHVRKQVQTESSDLLES